MEYAAEKKIPIFTFGTVILILLVLIGAVVTFIRFAYGLGATTNLSDKVPWGLWIAIDDLSGVALAGGGFTIAAIVYIFNIKKYYPVARAAIFTAFLGYLIVVVALFFDLGRPYRFWHPLVMWQHHSIMFAVVWCVTLYTTALAVEFSPSVLEVLKMKGLLKIIHFFIIPIVIAGIILSTLHQSSVGAVFLIVPHKLNSLWYTPLLPVMFFISAVMAGLAMVCFESFLSAKVFGKALHKEVLLGLAKIEIFILLIYLVLKITDLVARDAISGAFAGNQEGNMFLIEIGIGVVFPLVLLLVPSVRKSPEAIFILSIFIVIGLIINRTNVSIIGILRGSGGSYFPSFSEFMITIMLIAGGLVAFKLAVKYFNIFPQEESAKSH